MMKQWMMACVALCAAGLMGVSAQAEPVVGEAAPEFELPVIGGEEGQTMSLADMRGDIVVMRFQSINCPWDRMRPEGGYERVLSPLASEYEDQGVRFIGINSNNNESMEQVASYLEQHDVSYPILKDEGNVIADAYEARTTPHMFVIDAEGTLRYMGGIEQEPGNPSQCGEMDEQYLVPVIDALLNGEEPPVTETRPKGCSINRA